MKQFYKENRLYFLIFLYLQKNVRQVSLFAGKFMGMGIKNPSGGPDGFYLQWHDSSLLAIYF